MRRDLNSQIYMSKLFPQMQNNYYLLPKVLKIHNGVASIDNYTASTQRFMKQIDIDEFAKKLSIDEFNANQN